MRDDTGRFISAPADNKLPVGTVRIRTRHKRKGEQRAYIKIADPNVWILRAHFVWNEHKGLIPSGMGIHHKDENKLNDDIDNLELVSKREHLALHREAFKDKSIQALVRARQTKTWTTKSPTKQVGRHPMNCLCPLHRPK